MTTMTKKRSLYKVIFHNHGKIYEIYCKSVSASSMMGFVEAEQMIFGERSSVLLDPGEEKLKAEFAGVKRIFVPMHSIVRIDEVEKEGINKIHNSTGADNVAPFPSGSYSGKKD